jgi:DNA polymerase-3 subunit gamma/tau
MAYGGQFFLGISLYRRYRPQKFSEVAGQSAVVDVIAKSLEHSRVSHAYLFSGPRGCGKTTVARLLAKTLSCLSPAQGPEPCCECRNCLAIAAGESLDVIEIDGASNNGVDEVRELKSHVALAPFSSQYKVYIIDEVHMLSLSAFNALLKTLEEPPDNVVFVLATTEAHKVPVTIRSRCQHIPFHRIETREIRETLLRVCAAEGIAATLEALWELARQADGALRDALSLLEHVASLGREEISLADVETTLGQGSRSSLGRLLAACRQGDPGAFAELDRALGAGASPQRFVEELFSLARNLWLTATWKNILDTLDVSDHEKEYLKAEAPLWKSQSLETIMRFLAELLPQVRMGLQADVLTGLLMLKITRLENPEPPRARLLPTAPQAASPTDVQAPFSAEAQVALPAVPQATFPVMPPTPTVLEAPRPEALDPPSAPVPDLKAPTRDMWTPYPESQWGEALNALQEKNFPLYCALMEDVQPFWGKTTEEKVFVVDVVYRYAYEFLRLDRNGMALKELLAPYREGAGLLLCHRSLCTVCEDRAPVVTKKTSRKRSAKEPVSVEPLSLGVEEMPEQEPRPRLESASGGGLPFERLVREAQRWLRGDVILARRGGDEDEDDSESAVEE